jgi:hypothetical protein
MAEEAVDVPGEDGKNGAVPCISYERAFSGSPIITSDVAHTREMVTQSSRNSRDAVADYCHGDCKPCREVLSARLDGEESAAERGMIDARPTTLEGERHGVR